jgi:hypothetical protein
LGGKNDTHVYSIDVHRGRKPTTTAPRLKITVPLLRRIAMVIYENERYHTAMEISGL